MTLALIVLFAISGSILEIPTLAAGPQEPSTTQQEQASPQQQPNQGEQAPTTTTPSNTTPSESTTPKAPSPQQKAPAKHRRHKKKVVAQNCDTKSASSASPTQTGGTPTATGQTGTPCPPPKKVVRHGGTSEPSIQLAGDQPPNERDGTNQLLTSTDTNLKKLEGRQLSANQKDMIGQVRQFMQQSRDAMDAGDFPRSRTLAWKAQLLSEELLKPQK